MKSNSNFNFGVENEIVWCVVIYEIEKVNVISTKIGGTSEKKNKKK